MTQQNNSLGEIFKQNGRYENEFKETADSIGCGAFGAVFKAQHMIDDREYAIKKIKVYGNINE